jgi:hypothetical protein
MKRTYYVHAEHLGTDQQKQFGFWFTVLASSEEEARRLVIDREWIKPEQRIVRIGGSPWEYVKDAA